MLGGCIISTASSFNGKGVEARPTDKGDLWFCLFFNAELHFIFYCLVSIILMYDTVMFLFLFRFLHSSVSLLQHTGLMKARGSLAWRKKSLSQPLQLICPIHLPSLPETQPRRPLRIHWLLSSRHVRSGAEVVAASSSCDYGGTKRC
ncbi:uncharacterized protein LOC131303896 isoform X1 [Rhododendron vialii]|uniref:uncharacterized protein LOC131303896 isoform X1 n=1 Tax=Rhododendron vialii TaxID=182163 RepID=UPI00265DDD86|nr:uncharacterized protein LOC131303896 isoform X1 [Rhododendron vialii]